MAWQLGNAAAAEPGLQILLPAPQPCPGITPPAQHGRTKEEEEKEEVEVVKEEEDMSMRNNDNSFLPIIAIIRCCPK